MQSTSLVGRSILVVEDEPLIALDIKQTFTQAGAIVLPARTLGDAITLWNRTAYRRRCSIFEAGTATPMHYAPSSSRKKIAFVIHSGYPHAPQHGAVMVPKPASPGALIDAIAGLLSQKEIPHAESPDVDRRCSV